MVTKREWDQDLIDAVIKGSEPAVKLILSHSPDSVNARDRDGLTALHLCILLGRVDIAKVLLRYFADIMADAPIDGRSVNSLELAAKDGNWFIKEMMLLHASDLISDERLFSKAV